MLRRRRLIGVVWLLALLVGGYASAVLSSHLSQSFDIPGTGSSVADSAIIARYGSGGSDTPLVPVIKLPPGVTAGQPQARSDLVAAFAAASRIGVRPGARPSRVVSFAATGARGFVSADGRTTLGLIFTPHVKSQTAPPLVQPAAVQAAMERFLPPGSQVRVTGPGPLTTAGGSGAGPGVLDEILIGGLGALAVLAFVFASLLAIVPLLIAAVSVTTAFLAMAALAAAPFTFLKIFATGVGAGILLDATVVRSLLVPAIVSLLGRWNWWLPPWAASLLRVRSAPVADASRIKTGTR